MAVISVKLAAVRLVFQSEPVAEVVVAIAGVASTTEVEKVAQTSGKSNVVEGSVGLV